MTNDEAFKKLTPLKGCRFTEVNIPRTDANLFCEFEFSPAEPPIYDADHPGVGPGHPAEVVLIHILIDGYMVPADNILDPGFIEWVQDRILEDQE
jgi:hypothetical protein